MYLAKFCFWTYPSRVDVMRLTWSTYVFGLGVAGRGMAKWTMIKVPVHRHFRGRAARI